MKRIEGLRKRIFGAIAYGLIMVAGFAWNIWSFQVVMLALFLFSLREFRMMERRGGGKYYKYGVYLLAALSVSGFLFLSAASLSFSTAVFILLVLGMLHHLLVFTMVWGGYKELYFQWPSWFRAACYIGLSFGAIFTYSITLMNYDRWPVLVVLFTIWASDIGAFFTGVQFGRHPLHLRLSPKKTVEGLLGGVVAALIVVASFKGILELSWSSVIILGITLSLTGAMGDLFASCYKRRAGIKDSGRLIPGHGGILDRIDAYIYCQPFVAYLLL
jgi:phosphatidate cytidylyltransferase